MTNTKHHVGLCNALRHAIELIERGDNERGREFAAGFLDDYVAPERDAIVDWRRLKLTPAAAVLLTAFAFLEEATSTAFAEAIAEIVERQAVEATSATEQRALRTCLDYAKHRADPTPAVIMRLAASRADLERRCKEHEGLGRDDARAVVP